MGRRRMVLEAGTYVFPLRDVFFGVLTPKALCVGTQTSVFLVIRRFGE